jgi:hypothetical protein
VARLTAAKGNYAAVGQALMMFVPRDVWVTANFKETQLLTDAARQPVDIEIDAYPDRTFKGHVDSIQAGSGTAFSLLPAENATGNYVKIVQRVPVKIVFDQPPDVLLGPGMSVVPTVKDKMSDQRQYSGCESRSAAGDRSPWLIAIVVSIATFMVVLDTAIANVSLRYIAGSLAVSVDESTWVVTTYLIANAVILPVSGWLSNVIGRKRFYMICVALFTVASLLCGLASSLSALIVFRILQGLGGGGMPTSEQAMLADTFPPQKRRRPSRSTASPSSWRRPSARPSAAGSPTIIPGTGSSSSTCRSASSRWCWCSGWSSNRKCSSASAASASPAASRSIGSDLR